jgi:hypothetical protein
MVRGKRQCVDSAYIKANASMDSLVEKEIIADASAFVNEFNENSEYKVTTQRKKLVEQHHKWKEQAYKDMPGNNQNESRVDEDGNEISPKFLSNHTHYSPTDPDTKISVKPGKHRQLNYAGQLSVDDSHHVHPVGFWKKFRSLLFRYIFPFPDFRYFSLLVASC